MSKRGTTVPAAAWWYEEARRALGNRSVTWLADQVGDTISNVSRCLGGQVPTLKLLIKISDKLGIPRPVFVPQTKAEALAIHGALSLQAIDVELETLEATNERRDDSGSRKPSGSSSRRTRSAAR